MFSNNWYEICIEPPIIQNSFLPILVNIRWERFELQQNLISHWLHMIKIQPLKLCEILKENWNIFVLKMMEKYNNIIYSQLFDRSFFHDTLVAIFSSVRWIKMDTTVINRYRDNHSFSQTYDCYRFWWSEYFAQGIFRNVTKIPVERCDITTNLTYLIFPLAISRNQERITRFDSIETRSR